MRAAQICQSTAFMLFPPNLSFFHVYFVSKFMGVLLRDAASVDREIERAIEADLELHNRSINLIASENYPSVSVRRAMSTHLTTKYAHGYPGHRDFQGCENLDEIEALANERAKKLFQVEHSNVQPHTGSSANLAAYFALLNPGDTILTLSMTSGGHISYGTPWNISGRVFKTVNYEVSSRTGLIDMDNVRDNARKCRPKLIVAGASAYPRLFDYKAFREIADEVGAFLVADIAHISGMVAAGVTPSPVAYADVITTSTHKTLRGPRGGAIFSKAAHAKAIDRAVFPGSQGGPLMHVIAAKAIALHEALQPEFRSYQEQVQKNARALAEALKKRGFAVATGGTDNHSVNIYLEGAPFARTSLTDAEAETLCASTGIWLNKLSFLKEYGEYFGPKGLRMGVAAMTTRGMRENEMDQISELLKKIFQKPEDEHHLATLHGHVEEIVRSFPIPQ